MPGLGFLNQRYLKLPVWAWVLIIGGGVGLFLRMRHGAADTADDSGTAATPGDTTGGPYDPSGMMGFPAYTQPIGSQNDGIAASDPLNDNLSPDLAQILHDQQDFFLGILDNKGSAGVQCGPGTIWDDDKQKCVPNPVTNPTKTTPPPATSAPAAPKTLHPLPPGKKCPSGQRWDSYRGVCTKCGGGQTYDAKKKHCAPCPAGYRC